MAAVVDAITDPTPARRSFTLPVTDAQLTRSGRGFSKAIRSASSYLGTYREAGRKRATLTSTIANAVGLALVVTRRRQFGAVRVEADARTGVDGLVPACPESSPGGCQTGLHDR